MTARKDRSGPEPGTRICNVCQVALPESEFSTSPDRYDGLSVWCRPCMGVRRKQRRDADPELHRERDRKKARDWYARNPAARLRINERNRSYNQKRRLEVIARYGGSCACCGEARMEFLAIDHINGGGNAHRKEVGGGDAFYKWLRGQGFPDGFRVLCHNCNLALGFYKRCPHDEPEADSA